MSYDISLALQDEGDKFNETLIALDGDLHYVSGWRDAHAARCHDLRAMRGYTQEFEEVDFSPRFEAGYYNLSSGLVWMSMVPMRQYKAGLNPDNVLARKTSPAYLGLRGHPTMLMILEAYNGGGVYPCTREELAVPYKGGVALSERYALHRTAIGHNLLVSDCQSVIGLLSTEGLFVEEGIDVQLPPYVECKYATAERLTELFATASGATIAESL
jgi:hypothetical protein